MIQIDLPMPEACDVCPFNYDFCWCKAFKDNDETWEKNSDDWNEHVCDRRNRPEYCPLKEQEAVVRCKDCKYFQMHECDDFHKRIWPKDGDRWYECLHPDDDGEHGTRTRGPDWFCADGERKKGR